MSGSHTTSPDPAGTGRTPLKIIRDRERDLGDPLLAQPVVAGRRHHVAVMTADQRKAINPSRLRLGTADGVGTAVTVEAEIPALGREAIVERFDMPEVLRCGSL
jgi:hypothetical protein